MISKEMRNILSPYVYKNFEVAKIVEISIEQYADPDERRFEMKVWCRDNCVHLYAKRFTESPDTVQFDFESEEDAMMFALRWA